jgi:hypothetical protein
MIEDRRIGEGLEGSGRDLIEPLSWHLPRVTEKNHQHSCDERRFSGRPDLVSHDFPQSLQAKEKLLNTQLNNK